MEEDFLLDNPFLASRGRTNRATDLPNLFANAAMLGNLPIDVAMNAAASALQGISPIHRGPFDAFTEEFDEMGGPNFGPNFQDLLYRAEKDPITGLPVTPQIEAKPFMSHPDRDIRDSIQLVSGEGSMFPTHQLPGASPFIQPTPSVVDQTIAAQEMGPMGPQLNLRAQKLASGDPRLTPMGNPMLYEPNQQRTEYPIHPDIKDDPNRSGIARFFGFGDADLGMQRNPGVLNPRIDDPRLLPAYGGDFDMNLPPHLRPTPNIPIDDVISDQEMGPMGTFRQGGTAERIENGQVVRDRNPGQLFDVTPDKPGGKVKADIDRFGNIDPDVLRRHPDWAGFFIDRDEERKKNIERRKKNKEYQKIRDSLDGKVGRDTDFPSMDATDEEKDAVAAQLQDLPIRDRKMSQDEILNNVRAENLRTDEARKSRGKGGKGAGGTSTYGFGTFGDSEAGRPPRSGSAFSGGEEEFQWDNPPAIIQTPDGPVIIEPGGGRRGGSGQAEFEGGSEDEMERPAPVTPAPVTPAPVTPAPVVPPTVVPPTVVPTPGNGMGGGGGGGEVDPDTGFAFGTGTPEGATRTPFMQNAGGMTGATPSAGFGSLYETSLSPFDAFKQYRMSQYPGASVGGMLSAQRNIGAGFDPAMGRYLLGRAAGRIGTPDPFATEGQRFGSYLGGGQRSSLDQIRENYRTLAGTLSGYGGSDFGAVNPLYAATFGDVSDPQNLRQNVLRATSAALGGGDPRTNSLGNIYDIMQQQYGAGGAGRFADWASTAFQPQQQPVVLPVNNGSQRGTNRAGFGSASFG